MGIGEGSDIKIKAQTINSGEHLLTPQFSQISMKPRAIHDNAILELEQQIAKDQISLFNMMKADDEQRYNSTMGNAISNSLLKNQSAISLGNTQTRLNMENLHIDPKHKF